MLPAPRINDVLHRVTFAAGWESPRSQVLGRLVSEGNFSAAPLTFILERFLTISLDPSRQRLIEGPEPPSILNQFRRMPE
jgi:hypothetical protein